MEDYRYSMKCDDDDEDEAEVFDQEGSLYIPNPIGDTPVTNTNMSSSLYSFSDDEEDFPHLYTIWVRLTNGLPLFPPKFGFCGGTGICDMMLFCGGTLVLLLLLLISI